ncbi:MAG: ABC transporter permease [Anaerolineae bacterium]|nr:ABC transporter permease [Anaerolineae bacterium]
MSEQIEQVAGEPKGKGKHYYHDIRWRLLAEVPWLVIALVLMVIMAIVFVVSLGGMGSGRVFRPLIANIVIGGFFVIPTVILLAEGNLDLSMGAMAGLVAIVVAGSGESSSVVLGIFISLIVALLIGIVNGLLVGLAKQKGIVVTFAMSFLLYAITLLVSEGRTVMAPRGMIDLGLATSPLTVIVWLILVLGCAALMIFTPFGRRPKEGDQEEGIGKRLLFVGLPFVFSSLMAWLAGILMLGWMGAAFASTGQGYVEMALLAALLGGTAYSGGTGFVLSASAALVSVVLMQNALRMGGDTPIATIYLIEGLLIVILLPVTHFYHIGAERFYHKRMESAGEATAEAAAE